MVPLGILAASMLVASGIVLFGAGEAAADCSGALSEDYECHRERYESLARNSGVGAAFDELEEEYKEDEFVRSVCHGLTHAIGQVAAERHGDISSAFGQGDGFCQSGYYHGAMETFVAEVGAGKVLEEAPTICAGLRERSVYHFDCAHGLGHGFMGVLDNELFESLRACDALTDPWEKKPCYSGVFMENVMIEVISGRPSRYLREDLPLYPCTDVETRYKRPCYRYQTSHALKVRGGSFARVFELCAQVAEAEFRIACYQGLGGNAAGQGIRKHVSNAARSETVDMLCALGKDVEARSNCVTGAVNFLVYYYHDDAQARALCETFDDAQSLRAVCSGAVEEYYASFET